MSWSQLWFKLSLMPLHSDSRLRTTSPMGVIQRHYSFTELFPMSRLLFLFYIVNKAWGLRFACLELIRHVDIAYILPVR